MVDDHNTWWNAPISLETTWSTKKWSSRVFSFLLAITEVNCQIAAKYFFDKEDVSQLSFRKDLVKEMINNKYQILKKADQSQKKLIATMNVEHAMLTLPRFKKFRNGKLVSSNMKHAQFLCCICKNHCCKWCKCSPGIYLCTHCYCWFQRRS